MNRRIFFLLYVKSYFDPNPVWEIGQRSYGDYSSGDHLFPFRTEKLSPLAQMVLHHNAGEYVVADSL